MQEIRKSAADPARDAIAGLYMALGDSGMMAYLSYMAKRLVEIKRILKESGSVYLHCDPTASHYLKVVMDGVFGQQNFRNEIIWCYTGPAKTKKWFPRKHDTILFYAKSGNAAWHGSRVTVPYKMIGIGKGDTIFKEGDDPKRVAQLLKRGKIPSDWWADDHLTNISAWRKERLGYPTQKPAALLERIIKASSNKGDLVLDPFCGCGTTVATANRLKRRWVGIDVSPFAIDLVKNRRLKDRAVPVHGVPVDVDTARNMARNKPFDFEKWAITRIPGLMPNSKQVRDAGIDGRGFMLNPLSKSQGAVLAQVKGGKFDLSGLRDFLHTVDREQAAMGVFITVDKVTSRDARAETAAVGEFKMGATRYPKVQLWSIADYFEGVPLILPPLADPFTGKAMQMDILAH